MPYSCFIFNFSLFQIICIRLIYEEFSPKNLTISFLGKMNRLIELGSGLGRRWWIFRSFILDEINLKKLLYLFDIFWPHLVSKRIVKLWGKNFCVIFFGNWEAQKPLLSRFIRKNLPERILSRWNNFKNKFTLDLREKLKKNIYSPKFLYDSIS